MGKKTLKTVTNFEKVGCFATASRFLTTKMGVKIFYKKKLKEIVDDSIFGSRFWLPHLVVRTPSFFMFLLFSGIGRAEWVLRLHSLLFMRAGSN